MGQSSRDPFLSSLLPSYLAAVPTRRLSKVVKILTETAVKLVATGPVPPDRSTIYHRPEGETSSEVRPVAE